MSENSILEQAAQAAQEHAISNPARMKVKPTSFLGPFFGALLIVGTLYCWHRYLSPQLPPQGEISGFFNITALRFKLFASGPIPFFILGSFVFGVLYLFQIQRCVVYPVNLSRMAERNIVAAVHANDDKALVRVLNDRLNKKQLGYYGDRLFRLRKRYDQDRDLSAVIALKNDILKSDEESFALRFVAVTWAEASLPLLGFLGTVVGIGEALGGIQNAVQGLLRGTLESASGESVREQALLQFGLGFKGMAVAFDTTFLGLCGLIILGLGHMKLKKNLASLLSDVENHLGTAVAQWTSEGANPVVAGLVNVGSRVTSLEVGLKSLERVVKESDQAAKDFRDGTLAMVERVIVEDEKFESIRRILLKPIVEFRELGKRLSDSTSSALDSHFKTRDWLLVGIAPSLEPTGEVVVAVRRPGNTGDCLVCLSIEGKTQPTFKDIAPKLARVVSSMGGQPTIGATDHELISFGTSGKQTQLLNGLSIEDHAKAARLGEQPVLVVCQKQANHTNLHLHQYGDGVPRLTSAQLPTGVAWSVFGIDSRTASVGAAGIVQNQTFWRFALIVPQRAQPKQGSPQQVSIPEHYPLIDLPVGVTPRQVIPLSNKQVVILDAKGHLHFWDDSRVSPVRLSPESPKNPKDWRADPAAVIVSGERGWLGVFAHDHLTMWQVRPGGFLYRYEGLGAGFTVTAVDFTKVTATADGRFLVAIAGDDETAKTLIGWEFPQLFRDNAQR